MYHLNKSGCYYSFKEELKTCVVTIVREQFNQKSPFIEKQELQVFLSQIYVYLMDQVHLSINEFFNVNSKHDLDISAISQEKFMVFKQFANLSEMDNQLGIAEKYHQERIAKFQDKISAWYDYACFCMRTGKGDKGKECFKEILARTSSHVPTLLAYGAICGSMENFDEAQVYFNTALSLEPTLPLIHIFIVNET